MKKFHVLLFASIIVFPCFHLKLQAQPYSPSFDLYFSEKASFGEKHSIFSRGTNKRQTVERRDSTRHEWKLKFNAKFDSLYINNPDAFSWDIAGLPDDAEFNLESRTIRWSTKNRLGDYLFRVVVQTGSVSDTAWWAIRIYGETKVTLMPGLHFVNWLPADKSLGWYKGVGIEYLIVSWVTLNDKRGPSHGKFYTRFDIMNSSNPEESVAFNYSLGVHLSMERYPKREWFIPYFGIETGGMYNKKYDHIFQFTPIMGMWLYADQTNSVTASVGWLLPMKDFERLYGMRLNIGANVAFW